MHTCREVCAGVLCALGWKTHLLKWVRVGAFPFHYSQATACFARLCLVVRDKACVMGCTAEWFRTAKTMTG